MNQSRIISLSLTRIGAIFCLSMLSATAHAGAGYYFLLTNHMTRDWNSNADASYPRLTVHVAGGYNCWYPNDIGVWYQYAAPGDSEKPLYTEAEDYVLNGCVFQTSSVELALYVQVDADSPWMRLGDRSKLWNVGNTENGFYINPPLPYTLPLLNMCGLDIKSTFLPLTNLNQVKVSGTPRLDGCLDAHNESSESVQSVRTLASTAPTPPVGVRTINLKVGMTKTIRLPQLDPSSVWELDGGACQGDPAIKSDLKGNHTIRRVLPVTVNVTAIQIGQRTCNLTAYHYPERSLVTKTRIIFKVK